MSVSLLVVSLCVACYLVGAVPFGYLVGRWHRIDIRKAGSGNIGATNVWRVLGARWGIACFALDVAKGLAPTILAGHVLRDRGLGSEASYHLAWLAAAICCILGHTFPVFLGFRGGKGVATSLGVVLGVYPYLTVAGLLAFAVWVAVTLTTRYVSAGSIAAALALPPLLVGVLALRQPGYGRTHWPLIVFAALAAGLVIYRHRANLARLKAGTENRLGAQKSVSAAPAPGGAADPSANR